MHYLPQYVNTYVTYVCPIKIRPMVKSIPCFQMMPAPSVDVQQAVVDVVENVPVIMRGYVMDSLVHDRLDDARFLLEHVDTFVEFGRIAVTCQRTDEMVHEQFDETVASF